MQTQEQAQNQETIKPNTSATGFLTEVAIKGKN